VNNPNYLPIFLFAPVDDLFEDNKMRLNIYAHEANNRVELKSKVAEPEKVKFTGVRFFFGPDFFHTDLKEKGKPRYRDDDTSAVTFWFTDDNAFEKEELCVKFRKALSLLAPPLAPTTGSKMANPKEDGFYWVKRQEGSQPEVWEWINRDSAKNNIWGWLRTGQPNEMFGFTGEIYKWHPELLKTPDGF
jgi:hypothetical protein